MKILFIIFGGHLKLPRNVGMFDCKNNLKMDVKLKPETFILDIIYLSINQIEGILFIHIQ